MKGPVLVDFKSLRAGTVKERNYRQHRSLAFPRYLHNFPCDHDLHTFDKDSLHLHRLIIIAGGGGTKDPLSQWTHKPSKQQKFTLEAWFGLLARLILQYFIYIFFAIIYYTTGYEW